MPSNNGRRTTLDEIGDIHAPKGSREWCIAIVGETKKTLSVLKNDATSAGARLRALREVKAWKALGLVGWSVLLSTIGLTDNEAESLIKAKRGQTIGDIVPLAKHGGDRKGQPEQVDNIKLHAGGTGSDYLLRRMKRDMPEILKQLEAGDFQSVRQAAIAAGIVKVKTPAEQAIHWLKKCSQDEWNAVIDWMNEQAS